MEDETGKAKWKIISMAIAGRAQGIWISTYVVIGINAQLCTVKVVLDIQLGCWHWWSGKES